MFALSYIEEASVTASPPRVDAVHTPLALEPLVTLIAPYFLESLDSLKKIPLYSQEDLIPFFRGILKENIHGN